MLAMNGEWHLQQRIRSQRPRKRRSACDDATQRRLRRARSKHAARATTTTGLPCASNLHTSFLCSRSQANGVVCPHISSMHHTHHYPIPKQQEKKQMIRYLTVVHYRMIVSISPHQYFHICTTEVCLPSLPLFKPTTYCYRSHSYHLCIHSHYSSCTSKYLVTPCTLLFIMLIIEYRAQDDDYQVSL